MDWRTRTCRPRAYNDPGHAHELTFSCFQGLAFLSSERTCQWLADAIQEARAELNYALWSYVFMPNHVHLIVWPKERHYDDAKFLKLLKEPVSRRAIQFLRENAPDWLKRIRVRRGKRFEHHFWQQGRGYDRNIETPEALDAMIEYVHLNPVRKGLVADSRQWKWSSASWFAGTPLNDLKPDPVPPAWLN